MQNHATKNGVKVSFCGDLFDANLSYLRSKFSQQNQILGVKFKTISSR